MWANTGIHFGLNVAYGIIYGLSGEYGDGLILTVKGEINPVLNNFIVLAAATIMFLAVFLYYRNKSNENIRFVGVERHDRDARQITKINERKFQMNIRNKWNMKHQERIKHLRTSALNPRLEKMSDYLLGGTALDLACGLGGNSLFLARMNYQVQAIDISDVAIHFVNEQAAKDHLHIETRIGDLTESLDQNWQKEPFDLIVITYYLDRKLFPIVKNLIKKDGYFFMETYFQSKQNEKRQVSDQYKLQPNELIKEFRDWGILYFEEHEQEGRQTIFCRKG
ncbi:class I SAM-dependent methyltransferase [Bacillus sp. JJ1773]|uniref:class I SAM-dependent methyltransferase n=1 Tax=Bacillus sp. JJ1773 TaxID=3122965 RepID=UPI002FFE927D